MRSKSDAKWSHQYEEIMAYLLTNRRRPSKYREENRRMLYWIKYNRRVLASGKMPADRAERFRRLLTTAEDFRLLNQYAYAKQQAEELRIFEDE